MANLQNISMENIDLPSGQDGPEIERFCALQDQAARGHCTDKQTVSAIETILYVEDEVFVREVTREILRSAGYRVFTAKTAAEAAGTFQEHRCEIDLLLADVVLPGETGRTLAQRLQSMSPQLKVLLVTGYGDQMKEREELRVAYLAKPFSGEILLLRLREVLKGKGTRQESSRTIKHECGNA
jgi:two-component system, cell cycle sensor histidine kinase and response regulator CckA